MEKDKKNIVQFIALYFSTVLGLVVSVGVSIVNARLLGATLYGDLKFIQATLNLFLSVGTCGLIISSGRLIALKKDKSEIHSFIGAVFVLTSIISLVISLLILGFSFFEEKLFNNDLGQIIGLCTPLFFAYPFNYCLKNLMQGDNRIIELSVLRFLPQVMYLMLTVGYFIVFKSFTLALGVLFHLLGMAFCVLFFAIRMKPCFNQMKIHLFDIIRENKAYGGQVYLGVLSNVVTQQIGIFAVAFFFGNLDVGFFSLALMICSPLALIPVSIGNVYFKQFASFRSIPKECFVLTICASAICMLVFVFSIDQLVVFFYSEEFTPVIPLVYLVSFGSLAHGVGDLFNRFLGAHGMGKALRNSSILQGVVNLAGMFLLIPFLGALGASITKLISGIVYAAILIVYYVNYHKSLDDNPVLFKNT